MSAQVISESLLIALGTGLVLFLVPVSLHGYRKKNRAYEQQTGLFWEASQDGMLLIDAEGVILKVNEAFCRMIGKSREELEDAPFTVCLSPTEGKSQLPIFKQEAAEGKIEPRHETALTFWDGSRHWLDVTVALVSADPCNTYLVNARDVTERRQTDEALKESERRFRELIASVKLAGLILDTSGNITFCNDYLLQLTGWTAAEVTGKNWTATFIPERDRANIEAVLKDMTAEKASCQYHENEIITRDGSTRLIQWTNTILRDPDGRVVGTASLGTDVTEQKQLEDRYRQAQKLESVGRLAGGIAHDFNNLLTVINGYSEVLLSTMNSRDPLFEGLEEIKHAGEKASALTQQLLAFSRKQVLQPKLLDLNAVITDSSRMLSRLIGEDVELATQLDPTLGPVFADEGQIHQVLMNLAVNARDAMPHGGRLEITSANVEVDSRSIDPLSGIQPGMYSSISLTDNGVGMSAEVRSHLFEPFFTTKERDKGTGLGLSTVYGIISQSGGQVTVESAPGKGTSVRILLPKAKETDIGEAGQKTQAAASRGTETILLVEDQAEVRKIVTSALRGCGYRILEADSGE